MTDLEFDLLASSLPIGVDANPYARGTAEHTQWSDALNAATNRLEAARRESDSWNRIPSRERRRVLYSKGRIEGKVVLNTTSDAYVFGASAAIDVEHIGMVLLRNIEIAPPNI